MKTIILFCFFTFAFLLSCGDDSTTNSTNNNPCVKSCTLITPANDTTVQAGSITFDWSDASCNPAWYKFQITQDSTFNTISYTSPSITPQSAFDRFISADTSYYYWRVKVYYTDSNNFPIDSLITSSSKFIAQ